jgi:hypothetical protein
MIKNRFQGVNKSGCHPPDEPERLFLEKIAKIPVWDDYSPEEQQRLKEIFLQSRKL